MNSGLTDTDRDTLVAALLTAPVVDPGTPAMERIKAFQDTLSELKRQGGAGGLWNATKAAGTAAR